MGYSREVRLAAEEKIKNRRILAEREAQIRKEKIFSLVEEAEDFERKISACGISAGRAVIKGGDVRVELEKLKSESLSLQKEYEAALNKKGYTISDTEPVYHCKRCSDTGYYEKDNRTVVCDCLRQAMVECACEQLNRNSPLSLCTFGDFSLDYYSREVQEGYPRSPYEQMNNNLKFCKSYAKNFNQKSQSIFMKGKTGLGKTHLSLSIANEVIKKGFGVIYVSAPSVMSRLEKEHFSYDKQSTATQEALLECDLLIIDDLGTEFTTQFSTSAIYNIFNSRLLAGKPVIINTNLTLQELEKLYSQRFVSRIIGQAVRLDFFGKDIRTFKK